VPWSNKLGSDSSLTFGHFHYRPLFQNIKVKSPDIVGIHLLFTRSSGGPKKVVFPFIPRQLRIPELAYHVAILVHSPLSFAVLAIRCDRESSVPRCRAEIDPHPPIARRRSQGLERPF